MGLSELLRTVTKNLKFLKKPLAILLKVYYNVPCHSERVTNIHMIFAPLAQLVEHLTLNQGVQGSSPWRCTGSLGACVYAGLGAFFLRKKTVGRKKSVFPTVQFIEM